MNRHVTLYKPDDDHDPAVPAECRTTIERLQAVLDGIEADDVLRADSHLASCRLCTERAQAAGLLAKTLRSRRDVAPGVSVDGILAALADDRAARRRQRWVVAASGSRDCGGDCFSRYSSGRPSLDRKGAPPAARGGCETRDDGTGSARIGEAFADAGQAIQGLGRMITAPSLPSPEVLTPLAEALTPLPPMDLEPAAASLAELPEAALSGLEPVTGSASRVFTQLLQDVSVMPKSTAPKTKS